MVCKGKPKNVLVGAGILIFAFILALTGTVAPAWFKFTPGLQNNTFLGLWLGCRDEFQNCNALTLSGLDDWEYAVRGLAVFGIVLLLFAAISTFFIDKKVSIIAGIIGGLSLVTCVIVYYINIKDVPDALGVLGFGTTYADRLYWAFHLTGMSGGLAIIASLILIPGKNQVEVVEDNRVNNSVTTGQQKQVKMCQIQ